MTCGAILAGGHARRFGGRTKGLLQVGGQTILERQLTALATCVDRVLLVGYRADVPSKARVSVVADRVPDRGPLGGLDAALAEAGASPVLLLACDMPNLTSAFLAHLLGQLDGVDAVVPRTEHGYHPLCAVYAQRCGTPVRQRLAQGQLRLRDLLSDVRVHTVEREVIARFGDPDHLLANVNTQADLDTLDSQNH